MNKIILIGRLTRDPELKYTNSGKAVATFTIATNRPYKKDGEPEADFINVVVWEKQAENCATYLGKGKQAGVEGRLQIRSYEGNDGARRWVTEVIAEHVEFLSPKSEQNDAPPASGLKSGLGEEIVFDSNDIPF